MNKMIEVILAGLGVFLGSVFQVAKMLLAYITVRIALAFSLSAWLTLESRDLVTHLESYLKGTFLFSCIILRYMNEFLIPTVAGYMSVVFLRWLVKIIL